MAEIQDYLAILDSDPADTNALAALEAMMSSTDTEPDALGAIEKARKTLWERGELETVARLFDLELKAVADDARRADLLLEKGHLLADDLLQEEPAIECFNQVLAIRPDDEQAQETLAEFDLQRENWRKFVDKYLEEAKVSTDRSLTTRMYLSAAETFARYEPDAEEVEQYLRKALEVDPQNRRAALHLERLLRRGERWDELSALLTERVEVASSKDERVQALLGLADLAKTRHKKPDVAADAMKKVIGMEPSHPRALRMLADVYEEEENWSALVMLYTNALKRKRGKARDEIGTLLQIAMLHWKRLDNMDAAEEYFRRIRKVDPSHPAALEFYRAYYPQRGEGPKLLQILRQAQKSAAKDPERKRQLTIEMAEIAENELGNPEKAIDAWKQILREDKQSEDARAALKRLYRKTEKWNALLDLMKDEIERLPGEAVAERVAGLMEVVEIYRDRLKLDVMVINTYNSILKLDPHNQKALDDLAEKYKQLGRWNDLIAVLSRQAEQPDAPIARRVAILREIAGLWSERFGNYAQAIKPLEQLLDLVPDDAEAIRQLKEIYSRRRQWRALITLLGREASAMPIGERRAKIGEMARLAAERLGDNRLSIELWNRVLELPEHGADAGALGALANLYEREKRYLALADVYRRQRGIAEDERDAVALLEKLGSLYSDRLKAPAQAAEAFSEILEIAPDHGRALRTLRELYAAAGDYDALERLYGQLGQWDDLIDAFHAIADRLEDRGERLALLERTAGLAAKHQGSSDKVARAYERVLSVDETNLTAARALVSVYEQAQKWARLHSIYEILLSHADDDATRLDLILKVRDVCEHRLGSKAQAFVWTSKAYELSPSAELLRDLERLGGEADHWEDVARILDQRVTASATSDEERIELLRELGTIAQVRLHEPERARDYQRQVLSMAPEDARALDALEELAKDLSDWPDLLSVLRKRVDLAEDAGAKKDLLFKIAFLEEERLADLDAAAATYGTVLDLDPSSTRALRSLAKLHEARGDWAGLADVLERDRAQTSDSEDLVDLDLRLGSLYETSLDRPATALERYEEALRLAPARRQVHDALERFLDGDGSAMQIPVERRVDVANLLLPIWENADDAPRIARAVEVLRLTADDAGALDCDRRLVRLYGERTNETTRAYEAGLRVLAADPADEGNRRALMGCAELLDCYADLAAHLGAALDAAEDKGLDPMSRRAIAAELAVIYDERISVREGDDEEATEAARAELDAKAENAWLRVLAIDPADESAYSALDRMYRQDERWKDLRGLLLRREENTLDGDRKKQILLSLCDLEEGVLDNPEGAIDAYRRVLDLESDNMRAYKALERLYADRQQWRELEALIGAELDYTDGQENVDLTYRRAELRARYTDDPAGAVDLLEDVVSRHRGNADARELLEELLGREDQALRIARILEPLYEEDGLWRDLCTVLRVQHDLASGPHEAVDFLARIAAIEEERMAHERGAFDTWRAAFAALPADARSREAVRRLASELQRWDDAAQAYEDALATSDSSDLGLRIDLLRELAEIYDAHLADSDRATGAYQRLLDADPNNPDVVGKAASALDRLYEEEGRWAELVDIIRRQADWAENPDDRRDLLARVARISEEELDDPDAALATWREVLGEVPEDPAALDALERLYTSAERFRELVEILRRRVELAEDPEERKTQLLRIAEIQEQVLEAPGEAIVAHLEILDALPDDAQTLAELARLYRAAERYTDLLEILERKLGMAEDPADRSRLTFDIGSLLAGDLGRDNEALERFADVLAQDPGHDAARAAVEAMLGEEDLRPRAAEILRPLYEASGDHEKLASLLLRVARVTDDPRRKLDNLIRVTQIREQLDGDKEGAFDVAVDALRAGVAEPELPELVAAVERLSAELGREEELITVYKDVAPDVLDGEIQRRLYLDIADLTRAIHQDTIVAREYYQRVLEAEPDDPRAMAALENIYRLGEDWTALYDILVRKADLAGDDLDVRAGALAECARLCAERLGRTEDAILAWEQVLELTPSNKDAAAALEKLYEKGERWHDLADLLERRLGFAFTVEEAVALRMRLGEVHEQQLHDPFAAVDNYSLVLGGDPGHEAATAALERYLDDPGTRNQAAETLEPVYVAHQDWPKLVRIYEIKLEAAEAPDERLALTRYIARLYEDQLEDLEGAFRWYGRVFREDPADRAIRDQLGRLAQILERYDGLANIYQEYLDDESGDSDEVREVALTLADIYDRRTGEVDRALAAYRRVLFATPDDIMTFGRLEAMLRRAERWYALIEVYEDAVANSMDDSRRVDLHLKIADTQEEHLGALDRAIDAYRAVLDIEDGHRGACDELDRLFRETKRWYDLAELLTSRIERTESVEEEIAFRLQLAEITENRLDDVAGAIEQYETVLRTPGGWERALGPLERLVVLEDHRERIAELLEPVYRANDWWQKLVVILDAQLAFVDDPPRRVEMLREIAQIHESRGGDQNLALSALSRAWKEDVADTDVYDELSALAAKLGAWDELVATLEAGIVDLYDYDLVAQILGRIAEIHEVQRGDSEAAIEAWRRVLDTSDTDPIALSSLDRLLDAEDRHAELVKIVERRAELADDPSVRVVLLHRIATLQEEELDDRPAAITAYKNVLGVSDTDAPSLDALVRLYRAEEDWTELATILQRKIELAADAATRRQLRVEAAEVHDRHLNDAFEAIAQYVAVTDENPDDAEALAELDRLYLREAMWPELLEVLDKRVALESAPEVRAELAFRAAGVVQTELMEPETAIDRYAGVLDMLPGHLGARTALEEMLKNEDTLERAATVLEGLYRADLDHDALVALYNRKLEMPAMDPAVRREQYTTLADIHEVNRSDLDAAFAVWARALAETPGDVWVSDQLDRLAAARGSWQELADLLEERLADIVDAELEYSYATKLATLYEEAIGDLDKAADNYRRALDVATDELVPLAALDRIYGRAGKFAELGEILAREADVTLDEEAQSEFLFRLGDLRETNLEDIDGAVNAYRDVLDRSPRHGAARSALERLLTTAEDQRGDIVNILEPLYENEGDWGRLADLLTAKLSITEDHLDRAQIYQRVAELAETKLSDPVRALDAVGGWLYEDPPSEQALAELERLAESVGRWGDVAARLQGIIDATDSDDLKRPLLLELGRVQLEKLGDADAAERTLRTVLEVDPETVAALDALIRIYRQAGDTAQLAATLWRRGELTFDAEAKKDLLVDVADLREGLGDTKGAIEAWREVLELDESYRDAHARLAALYEHEGQTEELIEILGIAARYSTSAEGERAVRTRIAQLYQADGRLDEAVDAWQAVLDVAPEADDALTALEQVHTQREDWLAVQEILNRRLDFADGIPERAAVFRQMAQVAETRRESIDEAVGYLFQILDLDNAHYDTYAELERLLTKAERWHDLVELLERLGEVYGTLGNAEAEIDCLARAADVWEGPLENEDAAGEILEKILRREPSYVPALTRLARLYEKNGDWDRCGEVLQRALQLGPSGRAAADLYYRLGEVARNQSGDMEQALGYWSQALGYDGSHPEAIRAVEEAAREREDWNVVADMVSRREQAATDPGEKLELTLELSNLYAKKLGQPDAVLPLLEAAVHQAPDDPRVLGPLADLYFAAGRHGDAAPIYERLAAEARKSRKMKDVARYRQRLGGIFEAQGNTDEALKSYEEAFRVNPTDVETMAGLGRIYFAQQAWEKARRVYRSMVLQNIDPDLGLSKADVYYALGTIHRHLGEDRKAKGMFQRGLEIDANHPDLKAAMAELK